MQDLQYSIAGCATGGLFGYVSGGGGAAAAVGGGNDDTAAEAVVLDRRLLRPHPQQQNLRCPRCDSLDTKFCYYNNYNLSQPRHFCKSCRRYWTNGGVLRNVPVGGGCRKPKRPSTASSKPPSSTGRDSSGRTAADVDDGAASPATQQPSAPPPSAAALDSCATVFPGSVEEGEAPPTTVSVFPENGSFTCSLVAAAANPDMMGLNFGSPPELHLLSPPPPPPAPPPRTGFLADKIGMPGIPVFDRYVDQVAHIETVPPPVVPPQDRSAAVPPLPTLAWARGMGTHAGLFDGDGDHGCYWNQSQWGEIDPSLFLP